MKKYVVLLRGVNVGGKKPLPRAEFHRVLESLGFCDVMVYLNSGNAVFSSTREPRTTEIQAALENSCGFEVPTLLLSADMVCTIAEAIPDDWSNDPLNREKTGRKSDVVYLFDEVNSPDILDRIGYKPDIEVMQFIDGAIITTIPRAHQQLGSLHKLIGTSLYQHVTVRNVNTARRLAEIARG